MHSERAGCSLVLGRAPGLYKLRQYIRRHMLSLLQLTQNVVKNKMSRGLIDMVKACELEYEHAEERPNEMEQVMPLTHRLVHTYDVT